MQRIKISSLTKFKYGHLQYINYVVDILQLLVFPACFSPASDWGESTDLPPDTAFYHITDPNIAGPFLTTFDIG